MAGPAENALRKSQDESRYDPRDSNAPAVVEVPREKVMETAARLVANGFKLTEVARIMVDVLVTEESRHKPMEQKMSQARRKLRRWKYSDQFRDMVYKHGLVELDMESGSIMKGLAKKAKRGRVDAARLCFELTGRHNPKGEDRPTEVILRVEGIPRPGGRRQEEIIQGEATEELEA